MKYKVGDRVRITADENKFDIWEQASPKVKWLGKVMTIRYVGNGYYKMKEDCGWGWSWCEGMIDGIADEHKIVITTDGKITTAKLYDGKKFIKEAKAKCSPEDEFDFKTGSEIAVKRLFEEKENGFTGKAVYIGGGYSLLGRTIGKIYEFKKGFYYDDDNMKRPAYDEGFTKDEVVRDGFLPIKE